MKKRQVIIVSAISLIVLLMVLAIAGRRKPAEINARAGELSVTYVRTEKAEAGDHDITIRANGRLGSSRNVILTAEVPGKLLQGDVKLKGGSQFRNGQFLFGIDDTEYRLKVQARKSGFLNLLALALADLKIDFPESFPKWERFFESIDVVKPLPELPEIESLKGKTYLASKNILGEYYSIRADEEVLKKYKIYAPFDGNFINVFAEPGSVVNPGTQIARIIQTGDLEIQVTVSVGEARFLTIGGEAEIFIKGEEKPASGKILRIGQYVNPNSQSVDVFMGITQSPSLRIFDGMYVQVEIKAGRISQAIKVPRKALIDENHIYTVKDGFLIRREIRTELKSDEFYYVSGLENGTEIVVEAMSNPVDSMEVKILTADEEGR